MRWVIVGAGAVGGVVGGRLAAAGQDVVLVARLAHLDAIRRDGLALHSPEGRQTLRLPAVGSVTEHEWRPGDVAVLAVKGMDTPDVLRPLAAVAPPETPVVCLQNGVANERAALRVFPNVYGVWVILPASHLAPGVVVAHSAPTPGALDLGRVPGGVDDTATALAAGLRAAGFASEARADIMRWKYAKLLMNLGNSIQALCGPDAEGIDTVDALLRAEATEVLRVAGIDVATEAEEGERRKGLLSIKPVEGTPRGGGSSWQSLTRGTGTVEADYLNGEIVLLGPPARRRDPGQRAGPPARQPRRPRGHPPRCPDAGAVPRATGLTRRRSGRRTGPPAPPRSASGRPEVSRRGSSGAPAPSVTGVTPRMISSSRPASAKVPTSSPPPTSQMSRSPAAAVIAACTGRMSPETKVIGAPGIGGRSRWVNTQHGRSPYHSCHFAGLSRSFS